jgi:DNA-binding response OmpR family regulator
MMPAVSADTPLGSPSALIVEPSTPDAVFLVATLAELGFRVTVADKFKDAKDNLRIPPALLVTEIRLGEYNGLHLVLRGKSAKPDLPAIVTSRMADSVLQAEAEHMGATFLQKPASAEELRASVWRTILRGTDSPGPIRAPFERRRSERRSVAVVGQPDRRRHERRREGSVRIQHAMVAHDR